MTVVEIQGWLDSNIQPYVDLYFEFAGGLCVTFLLIAFIVLSCRCIYNRRKHGSSKNLFSILSGSIAAYTIPSGIAVLLCAFDPDRVSQLSDIKFALAFAAVAMLAIAAIALRDTWIAKDPPTPNETEPDPSSSQS